MKNCNSSFCYCLQPDRLTSKKQKLLTIALSLILSFAILEWLVGLWSHSITLQADAGHLLSDAIAIIIALLALILSKYSRWRKFPLEGIAALINSISLLIMSGMIFWEGIRHLHHPPTEILSLPMLITAILGLLINTLNIYLLHDHDQKDLNLRGVFIHILADIFSSLGVIITAIIIWQWNLTWIDTVLGFAIAGLILISSLPILHQSFKYLFNYKPQQYLVTNTDLLITWDISNFAQKIEVSNSELAPSKKVTGGERQKAK
jgi:cobalt-zinc-cadmium efflux system protein